MTRPYWPRQLSRLGVQRNSSVTRLFVLGLIDIFSIVLAWTMIVTWTSPIGGSEGLAVLGSVILCQIVIGSALSLYRNRYQIGSALELRRQGVSAVIVTALSTIIVTLSDLSIDLAWFLLALLSAQVLMIAGRQALRMWIDSQFRPHVGQKVVVVGAGEVGSALISQMLSDPSGDYIPVALVDDDRAKVRSVLHGVHVRGRIGDIQTVVDDHGADGVIVAIAQASAEVFTTMVGRLDLIRTWVRTVPSLSELLSDDIDLSRLRNMDVADLIGRQVVDPEPEPISNLINGRTVLVTGAGGSIGSELARLISKHGPRRLVILDRDESALHALCLSMEGRALMDSDDIVLADIRDADALAEVFERVRPQLVFHAAALKHLPMLERFPGEGWKTNVHGTLNVLRCAQNVGVERFVNISTDKAANPTSELGRSKYTAERLTAHFAEVTGRPYVSVRFGNVLGSRGSVLISFAEQIRLGAALTVTHPDVTRFFMTIPEACVLVLDAASEGAPGETMVLDMGDPVRIIDIALRMMTIAGRSCPITYTGLREGEKLHEELFTPSEGARKSANGRAWHVRIRALEPSCIGDPAAKLVLISETYRRCVTVAGLDVETDVAPDFETDVAAEALESLHVAGRRETVPFVETPMIGGALVSMERVAATADIGIALSKEQLR